MGKGNKERIIPINDYALKFLKVYIDSPNIINSRRDSYLYNNPSYKIGIRINVRITISLRKFFVSLDNVVFDLV